MTILLSDELAQIRQECSGSISVNYTKNQINNALQAIEDVFESASFRTAMNNAINTATSPFVFTAEQKTILVKFWLKNKFGRS